ALECAVILPMCRANGRESRLVRVVLCVVCKQPGSIAVVATLVGRSICLDQELQVHSARLPFADLVTAQSVRKSEGIFSSKSQRCVSGCGFVDEEQPDASTLVIQEWPADRQLPLRPQPIRVFKMGRARVRDLAQVSVLGKVDEL